MIKNYLIQLLLLQLIMTTPIMPRIRLRVAFTVFYAFLIGAICFTANRIYHQHKLIKLINGESPSNKAVKSVDAISGTPFGQGSNTISTENVTTSWLQDMEAIQSERQETLQTACSKYVNQSFMTLEEFASDPNNMVSLIYNDKYKVIYNFVHKVASQHLVKIFNKNVDVEALYTANRLNKLKYGAAIMRLRNYKKFIFIRDPFTRFVSVYRNKFIEHPDEKYFKLLSKRIVQKYREDKKSNAEQMPTFSEFVDYITGYDKSRRANTHWSSYVTRNRACLLKHDFIGKLETMEDDFPYLFQHLLHTDITIAGPRDNTTTGHTSILQNLYSGVSEKSIGKLLKFYENDFRVFGYNMSVPK
ncbi:carbohydrate sulfotransferase 8-like [Amphiura filiformis]|uniref:carbohydrate sulfotransferase 8-like n=1 Tax=Amphiura filiformis TaxID=82378 RepID=UPI003B20F992